MIEQLAKAIDECIEKEEEFNTVILSPGTLEKIVGQGNVKDSNGNHTMKIGGLELNVILDRDLVEGDIKVTWEDGK